MSVAAARDVLIARGICKSYPTPRGRLEVLRDLDLIVKGGTILAILGASGAGKSTLLNILGTLDRPDAGTLEIRGWRVDRRAEGELARFRATRLGFVFQFHHLLPEFSAEENVMMPLLIAGSTPSEARAKARDSLAAVGLGEADQARNAAEDRVRGELVEGGQLPLHELAQGEEVLGRVPAQGQLRKDDQLRSRVGRLARPLHHGRGVLGERADRGVDLGESDLHRAWSITSQRRAGATCAPARVGRGYARPRGCTTT